MVDHYTILCFIIVVVNCVLLNTAEVDSLCKLPSLSFIERKYNNEGFHRDIVSKISIEQKSLPHKFCLLLVEHFTEDMFVDPYQLAHNQKFGGPKVVIYQEINVEMPASRSEPFDAFLFLCAENEWSHIVLPVHLRYQNPQMCSEHGAYKNVFLKSPSVFIRWFKNDTVLCENMIRASCDFHSRQNCTWIPLNVTYDVERLVFKVPVGCLEHIPIVSFFTILTILCGVVAILYTLIFHTSYVLKKTE